MEQEARIIYSQKFTREIEAKDHEDFLAFELFLRTGRLWGYKKDDQGRLNFYPKKQSPTPVVTGQNEKN